MGIKQSIDVIVEATLIISIKRLLKLEDGKTILETTKDIFRYKNPKYLENEKYGYSNYEVPKYLMSYEIDEDNQLLISRGGKEKLEKHLKKFNTAPNFIDRTLVLPSVSFEHSNIEPREDQEDLLNAVEVFDDASAVAYASFGKCHAKGEKILMYDGSIKKVEQLLKGDQLMGPDSKPRIISELRIGHGKLFNIKPLRGDSFIVNEDHIMPLKVSANCRHLSRSSTWAEGTIKNIVLKDYLLMSKAKKRILKLWSTGVSFESKEIKFDPYFLGLWIGDGITNALAIANNREPEIQTYLNKFAEKNNYRIRIKDDKEGRCPVYYFVREDEQHHKNDLLKFIKDTGKRIHSDYLINSEEVRLEVLAGIIDSDGHLIKNTSRTFEISCKDENLKDDIVYLSRSLGFACTWRINNSRYLKDGINHNTGIHYRIFISGDTGRVPTKLGRKKATNIKCKTNVLQTGFDVEYLGEGDFYGFEVNSDHLYLMANFIVSHNTPTYLELIRRKKQPAMVVVHTTFLQEQWIEACLDPKLFNMKKSDLGGVGGVFKSKARLGKVNISLYHSLMNEKHLDFFKEKIGFFFFDEGQKSPIDGVQKVANKFRARFRYTASANLTRKDGKEVLTFDTFGPVKHIAIEKNSDSKILSRISLVKSDYYDIEYDLEKNYSAYITRASQDKDRNILICKRAIRKIREGKLVIIFVERKVQAAVIYKMLSKFRGDMLLGKFNMKDPEIVNAPSRIKEIIEDYDEDTAYKRILELAETKNIDYVVATQKAEVGLSVRTFDHGIITTPQGNNIERFNQTKGRIERTYSEKQEAFFGHLKPVPTWDVIVDKNENSREAANKVREHYGKEVVTWVKTSVDTNLIIRKKEN